MFLEHCQFIIDLGECNLIPTKYKEAETFVCLIYGTGNVDSEDAALRVMFMFQKVSKPKMMPPTKDALQLHIPHVHYQCNIWKLALCTVPHLPDVTEMGWTRNNRLHPILVTLDPIPEACIEPVSCLRKTSHRASVSSTPAC